MGMIPVMLAIAGFVLLWMIVNYNSLSARRSNIVSLQEAREQLLNSYINLSKQLSALLLRYRINIPVYLISFANEPSKKIDNTRFDEAFKELKLLVSNHSADVQSTPDYQQLIEPMELTAMKLLKNRQQLLAEVKAYNQHASRMPYRIVAQLFGFKKINLLVG